MKYRLDPFAGLIVRPFVMNSVDRFGNVHRVRTITNLAALKHFGGVNYPAVNDTSPKQLTRPMEVV